MKSLSGVLFFALIALGAIGQSVEKLWETPAELAVCESVLEYEGKLFASCINGKPDQDNSLGYISILSPDGQIIEQKWATGLNAPKGMGIWQNTLYVTDVHHIVLINLADGKIKTKIKVPGAKFLNDIAIDNSGLVAVSDMYDNCIYTVKGEELQILIRDAILDHVNGLFFDENNQLYAGTSKGIYKIDQTEKQAQLYLNHSSGIDGLEMIKPGVFLASDWQGHVYIIQEGKEVATLIDLTTEKRNAADIEYDAQKQVIYVPTFFANSVISFKLKMP